MSEEVFIEKIPFTKEAIDQFRKDQLYPIKKSTKYFLNYPTVYIANHIEKGKKDDKYNVYVGETSNIYFRTLQHLQRDPKDRKDWEKIVIARDSSLYIIGHKYFNKSLTLDIENRLMLYLSSVENIDTVYNRRTNQQNEYYTSECLDRVFSQIWRGLRNIDQNLFPLEEIIKDSALFKASPFHKLTDEQSHAINQIKTRIKEALNTNKSKQLILLKGAAGAGKTVVLSSLFYDLFHDEEDADNPNKLNNKDNYLLVNHQQQLTIYEQIARKLNLIDKKSKRVAKPTSFINHHDPDNKADVVLVDEAHLLWTQGKQSYRGDNQLKDIIDRARVVVAVFDEDQILQTNQIWEDKPIKQILSDSKPTVIYLHKQMRINSNPETLKWIRDFIDSKEINDIPEDSNFDLRIFDNPSDLEEAIQVKAQSDEKGLSRVTATYDWDYSSASKPTYSDYWYVSEEDWKMPWNKQLTEEDKEQRKKNKDLSWAEQPHTIDEVGSTYTVQGLDLNFAGVIIGPSVKYRDGRIIYDPESSHNKNATQNRTMINGSKVKHGETLLKNELNVLLTRGVNGLYIYAVDEELRNALLNADQREDHE